MEAVLVRLGCEKRELGSRNYRLDERQDGPWHLNLIVVHSGLRLALLFVALIRSRPCLPFLCQAGEEVWEAFSGLGAKQMWKTLEKNE